MNVSLHFNRAFTTSLSAALLAALMWFGEPASLVSCTSSHFLTEWSIPTPNYSANVGGGALFSDLTTVGTLFGLLRYVHWMQQGMKQASNAYARIMAGLGEMPAHETGRIWGIL